MLQAFGAGVRPPDVVVFHARGDATLSKPIEQAMRRAAMTMPGARTTSYFSTGNLAYVSRDRHTTFEEVYPPGPAQLSSASGAERMRAAAARGLLEGVTVNVTGHDPLEEASQHGSGGGSSVLLETVIGAVGALVILLFVFGTLPAVLMPLVVAAAAILNTFTLVWALTYVTSVSLVVQFLIALVGLGVAIDYALLMIFRRSPRQMVPPPASRPPSTASTPRSRAHTARSLASPRSTASSCTLSSAASPTRSRSSFS